MKNEFSSRQVFTTYLREADIIEFNLPETAAITLRILDDNGQLVEQIMEAETFDAGTHEVRLQNRKYRPGTYYYRLSAKTKTWELVDTKMIVSPDPGK